MFGLKRIDFDKVKSYFILGLLTIFTCGLVYLGMSVGNYSLPKTNQLPVAYLDDISSNSIEIMNQNNIKASTFMVFVETSFTKQLTDSDFEDNIDLSDFMNVYDSKSINQIHINDCESNLCHLIKSNPATKAMPSFVLELSQRDQDKDKGLYILTYKVGTYHTNLDSLKFVKYQDGEQYLNDINVSIARNIQKMIKAANNKKRTQISPSRLAIMSYMNNREQFA